MPYVGVVLAGVQIFFLTLNNFVASPFKALGVPGVNGAIDLVARGDGNGLNPLLQYPEMVIHPPESLFRLHRLHHSVCVRPGRATGALSGRKVDSPHAQVDDDCVGFSDRRDFAGCALGLCGSGLGRILGLGSGRKCFAVAVAYRHCVSALRDDAGKARHDESVECVAGFFHLSVMHSRHVFNSQRRSQLGARFCQFEHRQLVRGTSSS